MRLVVYCELTSVRCRIAPAFHHDGNSLKAVLSPRRRLQYYVRGLESDVWNNTGGS